MPRPWVCTRTTVLEAGFSNMAVVVKTVLDQIPFWLVGEFATQFRSSILWWDWDVHWVYDLDLTGIGMFTGGTIWILTHGHISLI